MTMMRDQGNEGKVVSTVVELDVKEILEQLGIDLANWPDSLPPLSRQ